MKGIAMAKIERNRHELHDSESTEAGYHYETLADMPWDCQKYFHQRYDIFSKYDKGIWMTEDAWFGVTPEPIAKKIANQLVASSIPRKTTVIDAFCGVGGNAISFALSGCWQNVIAIEKDPATLTCAVHNAAIYGVDKAITWYQGDCFELLQRYFINSSEETVIFASPPWGGPSYTADRVFDLSKMQPYNLCSLVETFRQITHDIVLFLPRSSDIRQIAAFQDVSGCDKLTVVHYCMRGASKVGQAR